MGYTSGTPYVNVLDFGAKGDGTQDDAPHIQAAINKAYEIRESGEENAVAVLIPPGYYLCQTPIAINKAATGTSVTNAGVVICGASRGPFNIGGSGVSSSFRGVPLLVIDTNPTSTTPFLEIGDGTTLPSAAPAISNVAIEDLHFHYKANENPNTAPVLFSSPTINIVNATDIAIRRCSTDNATTFIQTGYSTAKGTYTVVGRLIFDEIYLAAFTAGLSIDTALDTVRISKIHSWPFWGPGNNPYTQRSMTSCAAIKCLRADNVFLDDLFAIYNRYALFADASPTTGPYKGSSNGQASNVSSDSCIIGIRVLSTGIAGWNVSGFAPNGGSLGSTTSQWAATAGGGVNRAVLQITGGIVSGKFSSSQILTPYGRMGVSTPFSGPFGELSNGAMGPVFIRNYD